MSDIGTNVAGSLFPAGSDPWPSIRRLISASPAPAYACDAAGFIVACNSAAIALWGREPVPATDRWCGSFKLYSPDGTALPLDQCPAAVALRESRSLRAIPAIVERPDGVRRDILANPQILRDSSGAVFGALNTIIDITNDPSLHSPSPHLAAAGAQGPPRFARRGSVVRGQKNSEEPLRKLLSAMPVGVCTFDAQGRITFYNPKAAEIWGWEPKLDAQRFTGAKALFHLDGSPLSPANSPMAAAILEGRSQRNCEFLLERPSGTRIVVRANIDPLHDPEGRPAGAIHVFEDVTADRKTAAALLSSESRFRHLFETASVSIWEEDFSAITAAIDALKASGVSDFRRYMALHPEFVDDCIDRIRILDVNLTTLKMFRAFNKAQLLGALPSIFTPQTRAVLAEKIAALAEGQSAFEAETTLLALDGTTIHALISIIFSPSDPTLSRVPVTLVDITARKQAEDARAQLLKTAELLNRVGPIINTNLDAHTVAQNVTDIATEAVGAQFGAFFHNSIGDDGETYLLYTLSGVPLEAFSKFPTPRNTRVFAPTFHGEGIVRSADITKDPRYGHNAPHHGMPKGHLPVRSYLAVPVISRSGNVIGGLFFGHELPGVFTAQHENIVTGIAAQAAVAMDNALLLAESRRNENALANSNAELSRLNADLEQFAYTASHDLQEPIRNIAIFSQVLIRRYSHLLDEKGRNSLEFVSAGAQRLHLLVRSLLAYAQSGAAPESPRQEVESARALESAMEALASSIAETYTAVTHDGLPRVQISPVHLQQIFQNLISNAIKYRRPNAAPAVHISSARDGRFWRFSVRDNGIGIDPQYKEKIFGIFKRLHAAPEYAGSGIGLAICKRIVDRNGGNIWVESDGEGTGTTFHFTLPIREA